MNVKSSIIMSHYPMVRSILFCRTNLFTVQYTIAVLTHCIVWGDAKERASIWVDGVKMEITASLESALRHMRDKSRRLKVWADGVCINQDDTAERNQQVAQMGSVYSLARHTIIFLGLATPGTDSLLETFLSMDRSVSPANMQQNVLDAMGIKITEYEQLVSELLSRPWFRRIWVLQELVMSPDPWIQVGTVGCDGNCSVNL